MYDGGSQCLTSNGTRDTVDYFNLKSDGQVKLNIGKDQLAIFHDDEAMPKRYFKHV